MLCMYFGFMGQILLCSQAGLELENHESQPHPIQPVHGVEFFVWNTYILRVKIALAQMTIS